MLLQLASRHKGRRACSFNVCRVPCMPWWKSPRSPSSPQRLSKQLVAQVRAKGSSTSAATARWSGEGVEQPSSSRLRLAIASGTALSAGYGACRVLFAPAGRQDVREVELPRLPKPPARFVHPYEKWPWYLKAWFALKRSVFLAWAFAPFFFASTCLLLFGKDHPSWRDFWLEQMLQCTQRAGAAFQKFGQWLSMRPDMFPPDVIRVLSKLRADAPAHPPAVSRQILREHLGKDVEELFDEFQEEPVGSGSVGQVHRARLRPEHALDGPGGRLRNVAVKVQHPGVVDSAFMDLSIVWKVVELSENFLHMTLPFDRGDFDEVIQAQMDFMREAWNLQRFEQNFKTETSIQFPKVSAKLVTSEVLVETWADGTLISEIMEDFDNLSVSCSGDVPSLGTTQKAAFQRKLSSILYDMSMKMMTRDNFVHGDLHGGNILYSETNSYVTVLDAGIATSLESRTVAPFGRFLNALCSGQADRVVEYLQRFNESKISVNVAELKSDIQAIMDKFMGPQHLSSDGPVNAADMFGEVMFSMQKHGMLLKGDVASTLFTISISEGLIRQLDPTFDVARQALPYIAKYMPSALLGAD
eukprot:TRINITY_DN59991_c0_g1_i1.p1 TRINITY_DN59991_c0_g1~~TRINITY_DN59991_c0_g1_i1.p1  ORF type:complete len:585 (-),score=92.05 TRINITY_DN59991_c0_g1_i1:173-1927(-)